MNYSETMKALGNMQQVTDGGMHYRVEPTTEIIEGRVCERIHFLDAVKKYPDKHIVWVNSKAVGDLDKEPNDFIVTIVAVLSDDDDFGKIRRDYIGKGYKAGERRTTEGVTVLWLK